MVLLAPSGPVVEDKNVIRRHRIYMTSFVMSKVQTTVIFFSFQHVLYNKNDKFNNFKALSHYNVLANVCRRMKYLSSTLAYAEI